MKKGKKKAEIHKNRPQKNYDRHSTYRDKTVQNSVKNYNEQVQSALIAIHTKPGLTVYDFENSFISKLLSDGLVEACNVSLLVLGRTSRPATVLKLTHAGEIRMRQPAIQGSK